MTRTGSTCATRNLTVYSRPKVVQEYSAEHLTLHPRELAVLSRVKPAASGQPILDIGVGGGRTIPAMLDLSTDYLGVDYAAPMVAACQQRFPDVDFITADARDLSSLRQRHYAFVWFSYNGIDCISYPERQTVLEQIYGVLRPGGCFFFSSHNLHAPREVPWDIKHWAYDWSTDLGAFTKSAKLLAISLGHYARYRKLQYARDDHAVVLDSGHEYGCPFVYIDPSAQVRDLQRAGFVGTQTMGWSGLPAEPTSSEIRNCAEVLYLSWKP